MENKNLLVAIILSVGFLFIWSTYVMPKYAPKPVPGATTAPGSGATLSQPAPTPGMGSLISAHDNKVLPEAIFRDSQNEIVFSPTGGGVKHWRLKLKGHEIDLVSNPDALPLPLTAFPEARYEFRQHVNQLEMRSALSNGLRVSNTLVLNPNGYLHDLTFRFENTSSQPIELKDWAWGWGPGLGTAEAERKENARLTRALTMGKLKAHALKPGTYNELGQWAAIDNRYFLVAFLPPAAVPPTLGVVGTKDQTVVSVQQNVTVPAHGSVTIPYQIYVGPKGYTQLGHYHKNLEEAVDFGVFSPLGKLVLRAVYWLQRQTGNYGVAIVLLTIGLQLLMFPLTIKSTKAQQAMKKLQPQIAEMQKNFKSDPKRLNVEMMNLYKKSGTNPFGGCLPMLLQLPIFWALFTTLRNAYELRGAPFAFWIHDLSVSDPYHVLPLVMGGAMFFQQRMSGAVTDPTQKQMMWMMPIMFTVMFFNFPAGLVLYWLTNNLVTMAIQYAVNRRSAIKITVSSPG